MEYFIIKLNIVFVLWCLNFIIFVWIYYGYKESFNFGVFQLSIREVDCYYYFNFVYQFMLKNICQLKKKFVSYIWFYLFICQGEI